MTDHAVTRQRIGSEGEPLVVIDGFAANPDALRADAIAGSYDPAGHHYPGIRAALPDRYLRDQLPVIARALGREFGSYRRIHVVDARFSIVTTAPDALDVRQRLPHVDAYGRDRIALVHYLSASNRGGTAFFRHRATGFETIDEARAPIFFDTLRREVEAAPPAGYIVVETATRSAGPWCNSGNTQGASASGSRWRSASRHRSTSSVTCLRSRRSGSADRAPI
ncbi:DUF6445 family protein [Sphingomonas sp. Tas61C01]|uniref:DUF6445 family protein n=1 Tax=Sphingomonas sp. Tas61C01 TaxID=3458297 RepID=UPI00403E51B1